MTKITHETSEEKQADADLEELFSRIRKLIHKQPTDMRIWMTIKLGQHTEIIRENIIQALTQDVGSVGDVCRKAIDVFESEENAAVWLFSPSWALGGQTPAELFNSEEGIQTVFDALGRIQWGVFS